MACQQLRHRPSVLPLSGCWFTYTTARVCESSGWDETMLGHIAAAICIGCIHWAVGPHTPVTQTQHAIHKFQDGHVEPPRTCAGARGSGLHPLAAAQGHWCVRGPAPPSQVPLDGNRDPLRRRLAGGGNARRRSDLTLGGAILWAVVGSVPPQPRIAPRFGTPGQIRVGQLGLRRGKATISRNRRHRGMHGGLNGGSQWPKAVRNSATDAKSAPNPNAGATR